MHKSEIYLHNIHSTSSYYISNTFGYVCNECMYKPGMMVLTIINTFSNVRNFLDTTINFCNHCIARLSTYRYIFSGFHVGKEKEFNE